MKTKRVRKNPAKDHGLLISFAETIGSTLGTVVAKADALSKPVRRRPATRKPRSKTNKLRKTKKT